MPNNLNSIALNQYATRFSTTILNEVFRSQDIVTGSELLKLTPVRQVNLGILNRLFEQWKSNAESFRSPYFDFDNDEVKQALEAFMNTASRYIAVRRPALEPLLLESVKEALKLLFTPELYLEDKIRTSPDEEFTQAKAEHLVKYTQIHRKLGEALLEKLVESGAESAYQTQAASWVYELKKDESLLDDKEPYLAQFAEVFPINLSELIIKDEPVSIAPLNKKAEAPSFFDAAFGEHEAPQARPVSRPEPGATIISEIVAQKKSAESESLNSSFKVEVPKASDDKAYGTIPVRVESIAASIPLGQRFMFVNQLFNKNSEHFEKAVYELDAVKTFEDAQNLIWHRYASKYAWDVNGEAVNALLNIVKRKFN